MFGVFEAFSVGSRVTVHLTWNKTRPRWNAAPGGPVETLWGPVHPVFGDPVIPWDRSMGGGRVLDVVREGVVIAHLSGGRLRVKLDKTHRRIQAWPLEGCMTFCIKEGLPEETQRLIQRTEAELEQFLKHLKVPEAEHPDRMARLIVRAILFKFRTDLVEVET